MAQLNLKSATVVYPLAVTAQLTGSLADILTVAASHANIIKGIRVSGTDTTTGLTVDVVLLKSGGSARYLAKSLPVNPGAAIDVWKGTLDEGDKIRALASTTSKIDISISGFDLG